MSTDHRLANLLVIGGPLSAKTRECECLSEHSSTINRTPSSSTPVSDGLYTESDVTYGVPVSKAPVSAPVSRFKFVQLVSTE